MANHLMDRIRSRLLRLGRPPVRARHSEWTVISSADDVIGAPDGELVQLLLEAGRIASSLDLSPIADRCPPEARQWFSLWPGEHYRLLPALALARGAQNIIEIGTFTGQGALALAAGLPDTAPPVVSYDLIPYRDLPGSILRMGDRVEQRIGNLIDPAFLETQMETLLAADLLFVDGPKDGRFEQEFAAKVLPRLVDRTRLVVFDDIRVLSMVQLWRDMPFRKLDATSFGHWSGTGLLLTAHPS